MDTITIEGVRAYNGDYPLDLSYFTNRELNLIKTVSGVRAGELSEAFEAGDNDLMVAIAAIAIWRKSGDKPNVDMLMDAEAGKFTFKLEAEADEDESLPPPTEPGNDETTADGNSSDGESSNGSTDHQENVLRAIGAPG
jgi:hypothetical protein